MKVTFPWFGYDTPVLRALIEDLGGEVILPPPTSKRTLRLGVEHAPELICMPFKLTLGNFLEALEAGADTVFMAAGARKCRFGYYHYLHEQALARTGRRYRLVPVSQYTPWEFIFRLMPSEFGVSPLRVIRAVYMMFVRSRLSEEFRRLLNRHRAVDFAGAERLVRPGLDIVAGARSVAGVRAARAELRRIFGTNGRRPALRVGLVGEIYFMIEQFANGEIEKELGRLGAEVLFGRSLYRHLLHLLRLDRSFYRSRRLARRYLRVCPGGEALRTVGEAIDFVERERVDGIVHIFPFTCMPENIALEALQQLAEDSGVPLLSLSFDEHSSHTGLQTRLEAFVDLVQRRKRGRSIPGR
ncbi:MAG: acyl-CoA dehydratase activase-related protein [bacterium]